MSAGTVGFEPTHSPFTRRALRDFRGSSSSASCPIKPGPKGRAFGYVDDQAGSREVGPTRLTASPNISGRAADESTLGTESHANIGGHLHVHRQPSSTFCRL